MIKLFKLAAVTLSGLILCSACNFEAADPQFKVVSREQGSGTRGAFTEIVGVLVTDEHGTRDMTYREADIANSTSKVMTSVSGNLFSIGYITMGSLSPKIRALDINGVPISAANIIGGTYPIFRTFNIAVRDDLNELSQDYIDFMLSQEGQAIAEQRGYIPIGEYLPTYTPSGLTGTIVVMGSTSVAPIMDRLAEAYEKLNDNVKIEVHVMGTSAGITGVIDGNADIGMASRDLSESELAQLESIAIAYDGLAVIVHPDNPHTNLTVEQVRQIFTGELKYWKELN